MNCPFYLASKVFTAAAFVAIFGSSAFADCEALIGKFNVALESRSISDAQSLESKIAVDASCGGRLVEVQRRRAALELLLAQQMIDKQAPISEFEALVVDADKPDVLWRAAVGLGDIRFRQRRFDEATRAYERALETIKNPSKTPTSPSEQNIRAVFNRAAESRMLAANEEGGAGNSQFVSASKDQRDGKIGGTMSPDIRGFKPTAIPIPIGFETASAKFTSIGAQAAKELAEVLREQAPSEITLVGHTDERGEAGYNMRLSGERVRAVASYLQQNGINAKITTIAKGKSEPLSLTDMSDLKQEDIWALNRRVVWKRN
ncbi:OmpA family protein [Bradyrhizobium sp. AZCC 2289]|uniref:OmpA family protein n=1 Tax=Bradyrhizobium sp. AZCC 2289 TaxID=3117026 RepID=UPI002FF2090C